MSIIPQVGILIPCAAAWEIVIAKLSSHSQYLFKVASISCQGSCNAYYMWHPLSLSCCWSKQWPAHIYGWNLQCRRECSPKKARWLLSEFEKMCDTTVAVELWLFCFFLDIWKQLATMDEWNKPILCEWLNCSANDLDELCLPPLVFLMVAQCMVLLCLYFLLKPSSRDSPWSVGSTYDAAHRSTSSALFTCTFHLHLHFSQPIQFNPRSNICTPPSNTNGVSKAFAFFWDNS